MPQRAEDEGRCLERFRHYLTLLARLQLDPRLQGKVDLSGVVQQTLLEAHVAMAQLESMPEPQQAAWLRRALANNLTDEIRKLSAAVRDVGREQSLETALEESSARLQSWLASEQSSPVQHALRNEEVLRLAEALAQLPEAQREAVEWHHLKGWTLADIAERMERSKGAVAQLLFRGLARLRELLPNAEDDPS